MLTSFCRTLVCARLSQSTALCRLLAASNCNKLNNRQIHHTPIRCGLEEFFDTEETYRKVGVTVGRHWEKAELRTRSNEDLHKLWYVLLKEMNMLLTTKAEYDRLAEVMPAPERLEKVETSLDNLRDVVDERNEALSMLETGEPPHPHWIDDIDEIGRPIRRLEEEHLVPKEYNEEHKKKYENLGEWTAEFVKLWNEKQRNKDFKYKALSRRLYRKLLDKYPHLAEDKEFLKQYCEDIVIPTDKNPDVEKLIKESKEQ